MNLQFTKSQSFIRPRLIDTISSTKYVYIRQNIVEKTIEDDVLYEYEEAKLTKSEYSQYLEEINPVSTIETLEELKAENQSLKEQVNMLTNCILEMSEMIYV